MVGAPRFELGTSWSRIASCFNAAVRSYHQQAVREALDSRLDSVHQLRIPTPAGRRALLHFPAVRQPVTSQSASQTRLEATRADAVVGGHRLTLPRASAQQQSARRSILRAVTAGQQAPCSNTFSAIAVTCRPRRPWSVAAPADCSSPPCSAPYSRTSWCRTSSCTKWSSWRGRSRGTSHPSRSWP